VPGSELPPSPYVGTCQHRQCSGFSSGPNSDNTQFGEVRTNLEATEKGIPQESAGEGARLLTKALVWFASPSHSMDYSTVKKFTKPRRVALLGLMVLPPKLLLLWIGWVKATHIAAAAMALVYLVIRLGILHREVALRRDCRRKRLPSLDTHATLRASSRSPGDTHQGRWR